MAIFFVPSIANDLFFSLFLGVFQSAIKENRSVWLNKLPSNSQIGQRW